MVSNDNDNLVWYAGSVLVKASFTRYSVNIVNFEKHYLATLMAQVQFYKEVKEILPVIWQNCLLLGSTSFKVMYLVLYHLVL